MSAPKPIGALPSSCQRGLRQHQQKFIPAVAADVVDVPQLALHCQRHFQGDRVDRCDEQIANRLIDTNSWDPLANRFSVLDALALANVVRTQLPAPAVIADRHPLAAAPAPQ